MFKKSVMAFLLTTVLAIFQGGTGFAQEPVYNEDQLKAIDSIEKTNEKIYAEIHKAEIAGANLLQKYDEQLQATTDVEKKELLKAEYNKKLEDLIARLDEKTRDFTARENEKASKAGLETIIELIPVNIAERKVLIDPVRVVGTR